MTVFGHVPITAVRVVRDKAGALKVYIEKGSGHLHYFGTIEPQHGSVQWNISALRKAEPVMTSRGAR